MTQSPQSKVNTIRIVSTMFLVVGFLAIIAGLIVSINNSQLAFDFYSQTTESLRNAAESNSVVNQAMATVEQNKIIAESLFASGIGALLFGIGIALVDLLWVNYWGMKK